MTSTRNLSIIFSFFGLIIRWISFITLGTNFTHLVRIRKYENHHLITNGIYQYERHPSYLGYFIFVPFLQLLLGNLICFVLSVLILRKFFIERVKKEEIFLTNFFGLKYLKYREKTVSFVDWIDI